MGNSRMLTESIKHLQQVYFYVEASRSFFVVFFSHLILKGISRIIMHSRIIFWKLSPGNWLQTVISNTPQLSHAGALLSSLRQKKNKKTMGICPHQKPAWRHSFRETVLLLPYRHCISVRIRNMNTSLWIDTILETIKGDVFDCEQQTLIVANRGSASRCSPYFGICHFTLFIKEGGTTHTCNI